MTDPLPARASRRGAQNARIRRLLRDLPADEAVARSVLVKCGVGLALLVAAAVMSAFEPRAAAPPMVIASHSHGHAVAADAAGERLRERRARRAGHASGSR